MSRAIKDVAWRQIATKGAPALSLRGIARTLGITAPAIYNYFRRRDDLITALIVDAYTDFGSSQKAALRGTGADNHTARLRALGLAYRGWAAAHPERYHLMFGAPYPGYRLPAQTVGLAAGRALCVLVGVLQRAHRAGMLRLSEDKEAAGISATAAGLSPEQTETLYGSADARVLQTAVRVWGRVHGLMAIELARQYPPFVHDPEKLYRREIEELLRTTFQGDQND